MMKYLLLAVVVILALASVQASIVAAPGVAWAGGPAVIGAGHGGWGGAWGGAWNGRRGW
jgi:hypothetical protein